MQPDAGRQLAFVVDVLVTWTGAVALGRTALVFGRSDARSTLEKRARGLLVMLALALLIRGFSWLAPGSVVLAFTAFVPIALLPLAMTLFVEGLLRRHAPLWMKWLAALATASALLANCTRLIVSSPRAAFVIGLTMLAALVITMAALGFVLASADRHGLSRSELALIRICGGVAMLGVALAVTDFRFDLGWPAVRMGTLGALLFCYSLLRRPEENTRLRGWILDLSRPVGRALLATAALAVALQTLRLETLLPLAILAVALVFAFAIVDRLRGIEGKTAFLDLLEWLAREPVSSREAFAAELKTLPLTADAAVVDEAALASYDHDAIARAFPPTSVVLSLARLRALREDAPHVARGADDLTDLLESRGATHVGLLSVSPTTLLLVTVPDLGGRDVELALAAVTRRWPQIAPTANAVSR